jgi:hypothetical protein
MSNIDWSKVKHFEREEFDHPDKIEPVLIYLLDKLRDRVGAPCIVHCDYRREDAGKSYHAWKMGTDKNGEPIYKCLAIDFHFKNLGKPGQLLRGFEIMDIIYNLEPIEGKRFNGIGYYFDWNNVGFHVDIRPQDKKAMWVHDKHGYHYF